MALEDTTNKQSFTAVAGETHFVFNVPFFDASTIDTANKKYGDIKVTREAAGVITQFTPKETFSVPAVDGEFNLIATNNDPEQGGRVTISVATTGGEKFIVERDVAYSQQYDLQEGSTIDPTALNKALDRVVAQNQQQNDLHIRSLEFPVTDSPSTTYTVGSETTRANKALGFDASGNVTEIDLVDAGQISGDTNAGISISNNIISAKVDNSTTQFSGGNIAVKTVGESQLGSNAVTTSKIQDDAVTNVKIADNAVQTPQILDNAVTHAKLQDISSGRVLGNVSGSSNTPTAIEIDTDLSTVAATHTTVASAKAIKGYVDDKALDPTRGYNSVSHSHTSGTVIENTTGRPLFVTFGLYSSNDVFELKLEISTSSNMSSPYLLSQHRIISDGTNDSAATATGIVPANYYWRVTYNVTSVSNVHHSSFKL